MKASKLGLELLLEYFDIKLSDDQQYALLDEGLEFDKNGSPYKSLTKILKERFYENERLGREQDNISQEELWLRQAAKDMAETTLLLYSDEQFKTKSRIPFFDDLKNRDFANRVRLLLGYTGIQIDEPILITLEGIYRKPESHMFDSLEGYIEDYAESYKEYDDLRTKRGVKGFDTLSVYNLAGWFISMFAGAIPDRLIEYNNAIVEAIFKELAGEGEELPLLVYEIRRRFNKRQTKGLDDLLEEKHECPTCALIKKATDHDHSGHEHCCHEHHDQEPANIVNAYVVGKIIGIFLPLAVDALIRVTGGNVHDDSFGAVFSTALYAASDTAVSLVAMFIANFAHYYKGNIIKNGISAASASFKNPDYESGYFSEIGSAFKNALSDYRGQVPVMLAGVVATLPFVMQYAGRTMVGPAASFLRNTLEVGLANLCPMVPIGTAAYDIGVLQRNLRSLTNEYKCRFKEYSR